MVVMFSKDYQWFRNGEKIGTNRQYYSVGGKETDILDKALKLCILLF